MNSKTILVPERATPVSDTTKFVRTNTPGNNSRLEVDYVETEYPAGG